MTSTPPYPTQGAAYYAGQAPPPSYNEAVGGVPQSAPPPGFKPPPPTFTTQPTATPIIYPRVGPEPMSTQCPNCGVSVETMTRAEPGVIAYISGVLIFLFGLWCGCCLIPCCIDSCMDVHHTCPNCKAYLGRYRR